MKTGIALRSNMRPGAAVAQLARTIGTAGGELLVGAALLFKDAVVTELSTPGRGRIRQRQASQVGAGSYRVVKDADGTKRLRRVRRGVARTNIGTASRASAPGDPPAPDTGALRNSMQYDVLAASVRVGTNTEYAEPLNNGTVDAGRNHTTVIEPRPFMEPAFTKSRDAMGEDVRVKLVRLGDRIAQSSGAAE